MATKTAVCSNMHIPDTDRHGGSDEGGPPWYCTSRIFPLPPDEDCMCDISNCDEKYLQENSPIMGAWMDVSASVALRRPSTKSRSPEGGQP